MRKFRCSIEALEHRSMLALTVGNVRPPSVTPLPADGSLALVQALAAIQSAATVTLSGGERDVAFDPLGRVTSPDDSSSAGRPAAQEGLTTFGPMHNALSASEGPPDDLSLAPSAVVFQGLDNADDTLSLDLATLPRRADGGLIVNTVVYSGGVAGYDTLKLTGGSFTCEVYKPTGKDSGIITFDVVGSATPLTVIFSGLEPVEDDTQADAVVVDVRDPAPVDEIDITDGDQLNGADALTIASGGSNFEQITFANKAYAVIYVQCNDLVSFAYTRPSAELNRIEVHGSGSGGANYVFHQPPGGSTLGSVYIDDMYGTCDFSDFTSDLRFDLGSSSAQQVSDQLTLSLASICYLAGGSGNNTFAFEPSSFSVGLGANPSAASNTLDFSAFPSSRSISLDIGSTAVQTVSSGHSFLYLASLNGNGDTGIDNVIGGAGDDTITGNSRDNTLWGGDGNDVIRGLGGNDIIYGDAGADWLYGDDSCSCYVGADALYGGPGDDHLFGGPANDFLEGGDGTDTVDGGGQAGDVVQDAPQIVDFAYANTNGSWIFSGRVLDDGNVAGLTITFGDLLDGYDALTSTDGSFTRTLSDLPWAFDFVSAWTTDAEGLKSNIATIFVS